MLPPAERLAFVLHDIFAVPFDEIVPIVGRTPTATRPTREPGASARAWCRSCARYRHRAAARGCRSFFAASREGDFDTLVAVLDPDVVLRSDGGARHRGSTLVRGAEAVANQALMFARLSPFVRPSLVNGAAGVIVAPGGRPVSVIGFTVRNGKIVEIDGIADRDRLRRLDLAMVDERE